MQPTEGGGVRALALVDGRKPIAEVVRMQLAQAGIQTYIPIDPEDGWNYLVTESPDAAVVDIDTGGTNGWSFVQRLRKDGRYVALPVVVLTGIAEPEATDQAAHSLHCHALSKTMAGSRLAETIKQAIEEPLHHVALDTASPHIDLRTVDVTMLVHESQIEGTVYLPAELPRFSDAWEAIIRDSRTFVPVTDVTIRTAGGDTIAHTAFMDVKKSEIRAVYPKG